MSEHLTDHERWGDLTRTVRDLQEKILERDELLARADGMFEVLATRGFGEAAVTAWRADYAKLGRKR